MNSTTVLDIPSVRAKWKDRMLQIAFIVSGWSPEPEGRRHGCVLAVDGKYIVATGFNGPDRKWQLAGGKTEGCGGDCCVAPTVHAEVNALLNLRMVGVDPRRCVMYITKKPCYDCQAEIHEAGIAACLWLQDTGDDRGQWIRP